MKRQIRRGVFETNSSSMHSLTVIKKNEKYTPEEIQEDFYLYDDRSSGEKNCIWYIYGDDLDFGRQPFRALGTFKDKWLYACASLVHEYNDEVYKELVSLAMKYIPSLRKIEIPMREDRFINKKSKTFRKHKKDVFCRENAKTEKELKEYLIQKENEWGISLDYWASNDDWCYDIPYTGYVDENILSGFLKQEGITLEEYLTNRKYIVIQDGDEYQYWQDMKRTGLINMDIIDYVYPKEDEYGCTEEERYEETN